MMNCIGLLVFFHCTLSGEHVASDFCKNTRQEVAAFQGITDDELQHLHRARKNAILSLRRKYHKQCPHGAA